MKRASLFTALISLALPVLQAAPIYEIALSPTAGLDNSLSAKKDSKVKKADPQFGATADKAKAAKAAEAAKGEAKDGEAAPADDKAPKDGEAKDAPAKDAPAEAADQPTSGNSNGVEICRRLRKQMEEAEKALQTLSKPSRGLTSRANNTKNYVDTKLKALEELVAEADSLQAKRQSASSKDYEFTIVSQDQRNKYVQDATAAYKAMMIDVQQKKSKRKIAGLDKFEILSERYRGIPEFKDADAWYEKTLKDLEAKWTKMKANEEKKREKLQSAKQQKMEKDDDAEFEKLEKQFKAEGDDIAKIWYTPSPRNMRMLSNCVNKVNDALRRRKNGSDRAENENVGKVPDLLTKFWAGMDKAREQMIAGDLESARGTLDDDTVFNTIIRLPRNVMPDEYKDPIREQHQHMLREIKSRESDNARTERELEKKLSSIERESGNIEARIESLMEEIEREQATDVGESTVNVNNASKDEGADDPEAEGDDAKADKPKDKDAKDKDAGKDGGKAKADKPKGDAGKAKDKPKGKTKGKGGK